ncbi:MAG: hypothetical protein HN576_02765 [Bacteriovoracaceae bacterium]|nr:hypothetical protein [Bacteriovoracaceae bacterium]
MKFLKVFLICFSLIQLQVLQGSFVYAEDPTPTPQATTNPGTGVIRGSFLEADASHGTQRQENEIKNPSLVSGHIFTAIQMIVIGLMAPNIIKLCPKKASTYVYGAGALYYVAMELLNMGKFVEGSDQEMVIYQNNELDAQMEALGAAANETDKAADAAHKKADLSRNAAIVFAVAAAAAIIESIKSSATLLGAAFDEKCTGSWTYKKQKEQFNIFHNEEFLTYDENINNHLFDKKLFSETQCKQSNQLFYAKSDTHDFYKNLEKQQLNQLSKLEKNTFEQVLNFIMPSSEAADAGVLSGLVGGAAAAIIVVTVAGEALSTTLMAGFKEHGLVRAVWYHAFSRIGFLASTLVRGAAEDLDERAEQYRSLASKLNQQITGGIQMSGGIQTINQGNAASSFTEVDTAPEITTCFTGDKGQLKRDQNCLCKKANNCKKTEVPTLNFQGFGGNGIMNQPLSMFNDSANSLFSGDLSGAQASGAAMGNSVGKLGKLRRKVNDKFNSQRQASGQNPVNFDQAEKKFQGVFNTAVKKGLNALSPSQAQALASIAPAKSSGKSKKKGGVATKKMKGQKVASAKKKSKKNNSMGFFLEDDEEGEVSDGGINPDDLANSMNAGDMFQADISDRAEENIFKIITTRYLKSAYPNFFDENGIPDGN